jgi:hypothetical protein
MRPRSPPPGAAGRPTAAPVVDEPVRPVEEATVKSRTSAAAPGSGKLVAHFKDGQVTKGFSRDFEPGRDLFHLVRREGQVAESRQIRVDDLKALFHVKTWGRKDRHLGQKSEGFPSRRARPSRSAVKLVLEFYDGERIFGYSADYDPGRLGFYVVPADPGDNNRKIYVVNSSLVNVQFLRE